MSNERDLRKAKGVQIVNTNDTPIPVDVISDSDISISLGLTPGVKQFTILGNSGNITANERTVWRDGSLVIFPTVAATLSISSSSNDDTATGTGARALRIMGLDASYNEITEDIVLNGTTAVVTTLSFLRVNDTVVISAGTLRSNDGDITTTHSGNPISLIKANESADDGCIFTVPLGKKAIVFTPSVVADQDKIIEVYLNIGLSIGVRLRRKLFGITAGQVLTSFNQPVYTADEKTDLSLTAINGSGGNANVTAAFQAILVDPTVL